MYDMLGPAITSTIIFYSVNKLAILSDRKPEAEVTLCLDGLLEFHLPKREPCPLFKDRIPPMLHFNRAAW